MNNTPNTIITRHENTKNYTKITKQLVFNTYFDDKHLSMEEKGLLLTLLSLPKEWNVNIKGLATLNSCSVNKVERVMKNLKEKGFVKMEKLKGECLYYIYEQPKRKTKNDEILDQIIEANKMVSNKSAKQKELVNKQVTDILYNTPKTSINNPKNVTYQITKNDTITPKIDVEYNQNVTNNVTRLSEDGAKIVAELLGNIADEIIDIVTNEITVKKVKKFNDFRFYNRRISRLYRTICYITKFLPSFSKTSFYKITEDNFELSGFSEANPLAEESFLDLINIYTKVMNPLVKNNNLLNLEKNQIEKYSKLINKLNKFPLDKLNNIGRRLTFLNNSKLTTQKEAKEKDMRELPKISKPKVEKPKKKPRTESLESILSETFGQLTSQDNLLAQTKKQLNIEKEKNQTLERKQAKVLSNRRKVLNLLEETFKGNPKLLAQLKDFVEIYIAKRGVITVPAMKALLAELHRLAKSEEDAIKIVNNSIKCSYISFYKLDTNHSQFNGKGREQGYRSSGNR